MKNKIPVIFCGAVLSVVALALFSRAVLAETTTAEPTETQLSKIQAECKNIKQHLSKIRSNDALNRIKLGQDFETISNNLMEKLNTRIVVNKLNGAKLISEAADFNQNFNYYKENYQIYERDLAKLAGQDCSQNPREFYAQLEKVRKTRKELSFNVWKMKEIAENYKKEAHNLEERLK